MRQRANQPYSGVILGSLMLVFLAGCAMCSGPYDCHYAAYGGSTPRGDMVNGRVGSAFNDAGVSGVNVTDFVESDPYYSDTTIPMDTTESLMSEDEMIETPVTGTILNNEIGTPAAAEGYEWLPESVDEPQVGPANQGVNKAAESFRTDPSVPELPFNETPLQ